MDVFCVAAVSSMMLAGLYYKFSSAVFNFPLLFTATISVYFSMVTNIATLLLIYSHSESLCTFSSTIF